MFTSKTTRGFYDVTIHTEMPSDAVEITQDQYNTLFEGQSSGKVIDWDKKGFPFLRDPTPPTSEELASQVQANRLAAYTAEADPLFYQYQRDDVTKQVWLDKIAEIKLRFPKE